MKREKLDLIWKIFLTLGTMYVCIAIVLHTKSCTGQTKESINVTIDRHSDTLLFDMSCIDTIIYSEDDNIFYIEYNDPDAFDYETLAYLTGRTKWYGNYIVIDVNDDLIPELMDNKYQYINSNDYIFRDSINNSYRIIETRLIFEDGTKDILYELIRI